MVSVDRSSVYLKVRLGQDDIRVRTISETLKDIEALLGRIERQVRGTNKPDAEWSWLEAPTLEFTATANGVTAPDLRRVVTEFSDGFERAKQAREAGERTEWPESFDPEAKTRAEEILKRLRQLGSLGIQAEELPEVVIESAEVSEVIVGQRPLQRVRSTVEGELEQISKRGTEVKGSLKELNSDNRVTIHFSEDMKEKLRGLWEKRVLVQGMISYRTNGSAISVKDVDYIEERTPGPPLDTFIGAAPDITGGRTDEEFIRELRDG